MDRTAIVLGATGLTGEQVVEKLLTDNYFNKVRVLVRKDFSLHHPKLEVIQVNFGHPEDWTCFMQGEALFSCLGTTNKQVKGDKALYRKIDLEIPLKAARAAAALGMKKLLLISSLGASLHSGVFYLKLKGELERAVQLLPFESIHILRPSFLLGKRSSPRSGELLLHAVTSLLAPLMAGKWKKYHPIGSDIVAEAMVKLARSGKIGKFVYDSDEIAALPCKP